MYILQEGVRPCWQPSEDGGIFEKKTFFSSSAKFLKLFKLLKSRDAGMPFSTYIPILVYFRFLCFSGVVFFFYGVLCYIIFFAWYSIKLYSTFYPILLHLIVYCILFYILLHSTLLYSILLYSIILCSILLYSTPFYLFYFISASLFYSILFILFYLFCSTLFYSIFSALFQYIIIHYLLYYICVLAGFVSIMFPSSLFFINITFFCPLSFHLHLHISSHPFLTLSLRPLPFSYCPYFPFFLFYRPRWLRFICGLTAVYMQFICGLSAVYMRFRWFL